VQGSYARGAPDVGDVDLFLRVDEHRDGRQQQLEGFYRRAHPYAEVLRALGCSGSSVVNLDVGPVFAPAALPISRERAGDSVPDGHKVPAQPLFGHVVTGDPFDLQPQLVWVRGDSIEHVRARLSAMPEDFTPVPAGSVRHGAAAAALAHLQADGVKLSAVQLVDGPVTARGGKPQVQVASNSFLIYLLASRGIEDGWRHLHVWPTPRENRWLSLDLRVENGPGVRKLSQYVKDPASSETRTERIPAVLGVAAPPGAIVSRRSCGGRRRRRPPRSRC
jgi:hypothetical protein